MVCVDRNQLDGLHQLGTLRMLHMGVLSMSANNGGCFRCCSAAQEHAAHFCHHARHTYDTPPLEWHGSQREVPGGPHMSTF